MVILVYWNLRELHKDVGEITHKKKINTCPEETEELFKKHNVSTMILRDNDMLD